MKASGDEPFLPFADAALNDLQARAAELPSRPALQHGVNSEEQGSLAQGRIGKQICRCLLAAERQSSLVLTVLTAILASPG
jgi:hypothetical protein